MLVHDAARPFASAALVSRAIEAAGKTGAAIPVLAGRRHGEDRRCDRHRHRNDRPRRDCGWCRRRRPSPSSALLDAHRRATAAGREDFTDDAALAEWAGLKVATFEGEAGNVKLTTADDFARAEAAQARGARRRAHRLRLRRALTSATATMSRSAACASPHPRGLSGHSDADVVLHALVDAILGALAEGDIGVHFPAERSAMARRLLRPLPRLCGRSGAGARRAHRASRRHRRLRGPAHRSASRRDARAHRRDRRHCRSSASR